MNKKEMQEYLLNHIHINHKTLVKFAAHLGVSVAYISDVVNGKKPPSRKILNEVRLEKISTVSYEFAAAKTVTISGAKYGIPNGTFNLHELSGDK